MSHQKTKIAVLVSGGGSNLQCIIDQCEQGEINAEIVLVIANRPHAFGLERAKNAGIKGQLIDHTEYESRESFDQALVDALAPFEPDLVVLAGFMRVLTPVFVNAYQGRLLNIHPSLLPKYPGLHTHRRALEAGDTHAGATVHFVTPELDGGPPIVQARVQIKADDTEQTLAQRVLIQEHIIYPLAVQWFVNGQLELKDNHAIFEHQILPETGKIIDG